MFSSMTEWWEGFVVRHPRVESMVRALRPYRPPLNFITLHYLYFIVVSLIGSVVFYGSSDPRFSISYTDSLFVVVSAMTEAGLNTVNLSQMTTWQQVLLWLLIIFGSSIWVSIWTVLARKHAFERRFKDIVRRSREKRPEPGSLDRRRTLTEDLPIMKKIRTIGRGKNLPMKYEEAGRADHRSNPTQPDLAKSSPVLPISDPVQVPKLSQTVPESSGGELPETQHTPDAQNNDHIVFAEHIPRSKASATGVNHGGSVVRRHQNNSTEDETDLAKFRRHLHSLNFLTSKKVGRNAQFHDLTGEERELLGGTEYRALKILSIIVPGYFVVWQGLGCLALGAWINNNQPGPALDNAISPWWNGIFNGVSAFNNSGMSVLDANMIPYGSSYFVLVVMGAMILAGNTAYPVFLRLSLWAMLKLLDLLTYEESYRDLKHTLDYILKYPRRVYTNLFPARTTWWLVFMLFVLNGTDWVAFEILNLGNAALEQIPVGSRIIDGLFQALAVRSGGFYVVAIPTLYIGLQVLYVIMMYISVYPVVITMRHSNVYEERSLGIYEGDYETEPNSYRDRGRSRSKAGPTSMLDMAIRRTLSGWHGVGAAPQQGPSMPESRISFISHQIRGQLSHDLWWLVLAVFVITTIETRHFLEDPITFSVFNVLFEVVSAYGCVGISVGLPTVAYSFSGGWYAGSKIVLCLVMLRGRHRGLPVALDRAVRLPGDGLERDEEEDHRIRRSMSIRRPSI